MKVYLSADPEDFYDPNDHSEDNQPDKNWQWGHVYLLDSGDHDTFKIGHTKYLIQRLEQLQETPVKMPTPSSLRYLVTCEINTNCSYVEELLHMRFDSLHINGEWFKLRGDDLIDCIEAMATFTTSPIHFYDTWFDYFCSHEVNIQGWVERYAGKPYQFHTARESRYEQVTDDQHLLMMYEDTDADPRLYGGDNKFLKWKEA